MKTHEYLQFVHASVRTLSHWEPFTLQRKESGENCEAEVGKGELNVCVFERERERQREKALILQPLFPVSSEAGALQGSFSNNYTVFSFPLTDYISTLEPIPLNYKQLLYLTKVLLSAVRETWENAGHYKMSQTDA